MQMNIALLLVASVAAVEVEIFHLDSNPNPTAAPGWKCVDRVNPNTGESVCASFTEEQTNKFCRTKMSDEWMFVNCPTKCKGFCPSESELAANSDDKPCEDLVNPYTGEKLCSERNKIMCRIVPFMQMMIHRCPKTCGACKSPTVSP